MPNKSNERKPNPYQAQLERITGALSPFEDEMRTAIMRDDAVGNCLRIFEKYEFSFSVGPSDQNGPFIQATINGAAYMKGIFPRNRVSTSAYIAIPDQCGVD